MLISVTFFSSPIDLQRSRDPPLQGPGLPVLRVPAKFREIAAAVDALVTPPRSKTLRSKVFENEKMKQIVFFR